MFQGNQRQFFCPWEQIALISSCHHQQQQPHHSPSSNLSQQIIKVNQFKLNDYCQTKLLKSKKNNKFNQFQIYNKNKNLTIYSKLRKNHKKNKSVVKNQDDDIILKIESKQIQRQKKREKQKQRQKQWENQKQRQKQKQKQKNQRKQVKIKKVNTISMHNALEKRYFLTQAQTTLRKVLIQERKQNISKIISLRKIPTNNTNIYKNLNPSICCQKSKQLQNQKSNNNKNNSVIQDIKKLPIMNKNTDNANKSSINSSKNIFQTCSNNNSIKIKNTHFKTQNQTIEHSTLEKQRQKTLNKKDMVFVSNSHFNLYGYSNFKYNQDRNQSKQQQYQKLDQSQNKKEFNSNSYNISKNFKGINSQLTNLYKTEEFVTRQDLKNHLKNVLKFQQCMNKQHLIKQQKKGLNSSPSEVLKWNHLNKNKFNSSQSQVKQQKFCSQKKEENSSFMHHNNSFYLKRTALGKTFNKSKTPQIQPRSFLLPKIQVCDWQT